jgi:hypothetical protein
VNSTKDAFGNEPVISTWEEGEGRERRCALYDDRR